LEKLSATTVLAAWALLPTAGFCADGGPPRVFAHYMVHFAALGKSWGEYAREIRLSLGAGTGTRLTLTAIGPDASETVDALARLINSLDAHCPGAEGAAKNVPALYPVA